MRQRVLIAFSVACHAKLIIADEPTTALDVTTQAQIIELFKDLQHKLHTSIVFISHDLGVIWRRGPCPEKNASLNPSLQPGDYS